MNFNITPTTIFLSVMGSHAYGTATPDSDIDLRGVCIAPLNIRLSYQHSFDQYQGTGNIFKELVPQSSHLSKSWEDCCIYDLVKAVKLISLANPNMLELLFTEDIMFALPAWEKIVEIRDAFLSKKVKYTFMGYAHAQAKKIKSHREWLLHPPSKAPLRSDFGLPESSILPADQQHEIQRQIDLIIQEWKTDEILEGAVGDVVREKMKNFWSSVLNISESELDEKLVEVAVRSVGISEDVLEILKSERKYRTAMAHWKSYLSWKNSRNPIRAELESKFGFDTKHALHLIRLARMGLEILETGKVLVKRPDAEELLAIRRGSFSFDQVEEMFNNLEFKVEEAYKTTKLPKTANHDLIDKTLFDILVSK